LAKFGEKLPNFGEKLPKFGEKLASKWNDSLRRRIPTLLKGFSAKKWLCVYWGFFNYGKCWAKLVNAVRRLHDCEYFFEREKKSPNKKVFKIGAFVFCQTVNETLICCLALKALIRLRQWQPVKTSLGYGGWGRGGANTRGPFCMQEMNNSLPLKAKGFKRPLKANSSFFKPEAWLQ
jgi:hypothetical protein